MKSDKSNRAVVSDFLQERGFARTQIQLLFSVPKDDAFSVRRRYLKDERERRKKQRQAKPIPAHLKTSKEREAWCAKNGGHDISSFCEAWRCVRCNLSGFD